MDKSKSTIAVIAVAAVVILAAFVTYSLNVASGPAGSSTAASSSQRHSYTIQAGNETVIATYVNSFSFTRANTTASTTASSLFIVPSTSTTTTSSSTFTTTQSTSPSGEFTYSPQSPVEVMSATAQVSQTPSGNRSLTFSVLFENAGTSPITVVAGGGSSLNATIVSGSSVVKEVPVKVRCMIATALVTVDPGQSSTAVTPGCWSGYAFVVTSSGTVDVNMTLTWTMGTGSSTQRGTTTIEAQFTF